MRFSSILTACCFLASVSTANAGQNTGVLDLTFVAVLKNGDVHVQLPASHINPDNCADDSKILIKYSGNNNLESRVAGLMSALYARGKVNFNLDGCEGAFAVSKIEVFYAN